MNDNRKHNHSSIRRVVAAVLIVAAAVALVGVVLVFQCLSFDENGAHVIDRYGILAMEAAENQNNEISSEHAEQPSQHPAEQPEPTQDSIHAAMLSADAVADSDTMQLLQQLAQQGMLDTIVVNIKDSDGYLNIHVDTNAIDNVEDITENSADQLEQAITTLRDAGVHVIGRIFCMHDQQATALNETLAMQYDGGGTWLDYDNTNWLDVTNRDTIEYLSDIAKSAVDAGCDEILLDEFTFPMRGHIDRIDFDDTPHEQADVLLDSLQKIQQEVGVPVSLTADTLSALTDLSYSAAEDGFPAGDVEALLAAADRIFAPVDSTDDVEQVVAQIQELASDAVVIPVLDSVSEWMAYKGDVVLRAVQNTEEALAIMNGDETDSIDEWSEDESENIDEDDTDYDDDYSDEYEA